MPSWEEIKTVLDSPYVPADKKNRLMQAYDNDTFNFNDEQEAYAKKYLEGYAENTLDLSWHPGGDNGLPGAYNDAKADLDAGQAEAEQATDARDRAKSTLDAMPAPGSGGTGAQNSNELLDQGKPACDFLCQWIDQVWNRRPSGGALDYMREIWGRYNRDRNINFARFLADADALTSAHQVNDDAMTGAKTELTTLFAEWRGQGATAAKVGFEERIQPDHQRLQDHIDGAAQLIPRTVAAVFTAVRTKVDAVLGLYRTTVAQAPLEMAAKVVKIARKETDDKRDLLDVAGWVDSVCGSDLSERLQSDDCGLNDENRDYAYDLCARWVAGSFTPEFQGLLDAFDNYCETAQTTVEQQLGALSDYLSGYHNEFTEPAQPSGATTPVGTGSGGGTSAASGSTAAPATAAPPTSDPATVADAAKQEAAAGIDPMTGQPLETDPGTGEAIKDAGWPEALTVQQGDNKIEMSEPDQTGRMDIKLDDGHGDAKDFRLDWGDGQAGQPVPPPGDPVPRPVDPDQQGGAPAAGDPTYQPGPDGKIHIQHGNLAITAERPEGPGGPTVVTVDDGTGRPTTYTLGDDQAALGPRPSVPGTGTAVNSAGGLDTGAASTDPAGTGAGGVAGAGMVNPSPGQPGFTAPGGIDVGHALGADAAAAGTGDATASGGGMAGGEPAGGAVGADTAGGETADGEAVGNEASGGGAISGGTPGGEAVGTGGADVGQQTTPASASGGAATADVGIGGFGGNLGDGHSPDAWLQSGAQVEALFDHGAQAGVPLDTGQQPGAGLDQHPVPAAAGVAPAGTADPSAAGQQPAAVGGSGFGMGGMGMMGGVGGIGGGGGEDQERSSRAYRVDGGIFNAGGAGGRISGSLDDEGEARS
jgi:hypothetical protein